MIMWLIQYSEGNFVDARKIEFLSVAIGEVKFWTATSGSHKVSAGYVGPFLNQYQALNASTINVEQRFYQLNEKENHR